MIYPYNNAVVTYRAMITSGSFKSILAMHRLVLLILFFTGLHCHAQKTSYIKFSPELNKDTLQITVIDTTLTMDIHMPTGTMEIKGKLALYNQYDMQLGAHKEQTFFSANEKMLNINFYQDEFKKVTAKKPFHTVGFAVLYLHEISGYYNKPILPEKIREEIILHNRRSALSFKTQSASMRIAHNFVIDQGRNFYLYIQRGVIKKINIYDQDKLIWQGSYMQLLAEFFANRNIPGQL